MEHRKMQLVYACCILGGLGLGVLIGQFSTPERINLEDYMDDEQQTGDMQPDDDLSESDDKITPVTQTNVYKGRRFEGTAGETLNIHNALVQVRVDRIDDGNLHFFNTTLPSGKTVYYFILRSPSGKIKAAANGCDECGRSLLGFSQSGSFIISHACGTKYPFDQVATQASRCHPVPISADLPIQDGRVQIALQQLNAIVPYFD